MTTKRFILLLALMGFCFISFAQSDAYYWADGKKISLQEDPGSMVVYFHPNAQVRQLSAPASLDVKYFGYHQRAVIRSTSRQTLNKNKVIQDLGISPASVRSISSGYVIQDDGFQLALTHEVVVQLNPGSSIAVIEPLMNQYGATYLRTSNDQIILEVTDIKNVLPLANALQESGLTMWATPDLYAEVTHYADPLYPEQFQMNNTGQTIDGFVGVNDMDCNAPEAWAITTGSSSVTVAVIDDGVEAHEDLVTAGGATRVLSGYSPVGNGTGAPVAGSAHGESCAGIIAASHNNLGVQGVAPEVFVRTVNIFVGGETTQNIADAITYAKNSGAQVLSNSWGYTSCTFTATNITNAINDASTTGRGGLGCVIVFASGNGYKTCVDYPANLSAVIAVGAFGNDGIKSSYSNAGTALDICAPSNDVSSAGFLTGAGVRTTDRMGSAGYESGNYTTGFGGTSAACPVVAGVAALVVSVNPALTLTDVKNILYTTAIDMGTAGFDNSYGNGRVNALGAVQAAGGGGGGDTQDPSVPTNLAASNTTQTSTDLTWTASTDNVGVTGYNVFVDGILDGTTASTSYTVSGLAAATTYAISVSAYDAAGNESAQTSINVTTQSGGGGSDTTVLSADFFETGLDGWTDGGVDCARLSTAFSWEGSFSVQLRDNSGVPSSMTKGGYNLTSYSAVEVKFYFYPNSMEAGEDFWLRYNSGAGYQTVATYARGTSFNNGSFYVATVLLTPSQVTFSANASFRFQCDASADNDQIYIDQVTVRGIGAGGASIGASTIEVIPGFGNTDLSGRMTEDVAVYPNPVTDFMFVESASAVKSVRVYTVTGALVKTESTVENNQVSVNVSQMVPGVYMVAIETEDEVIYKKVLKK
ncbi:MAG: S8 family serine peptidase [Bacteroidia bacterium]|nr:S8 family serine peptidase [Bacteroidia bacterium]